MTSFDPLAFEGTAEHYAAGRPPYSRELAEALRREVGLDEATRLLDVGCGPGVLELQLAPLVAEVVAVEPDPGMVEVARRRCRDAGILNVQWLQGVAEELGTFGIGPFRVVTFGQSFHRVKRVQVANTVWDLLEPGGSLVLITHEVEGRPRPEGPALPDIPHAAVRALIVDYLGDDARRYFERCEQGQSERFQDSLRRTRFGDSRVVYLPGRVDLIRDVAAVTDNVLSMSYAAPRRFGDRLADFKADLRALLLGYSAEGSFLEWPGDTELVIATKGL